MSVCILPNAAQVEMDPILHGPDSSIYLDYIGHWSNRSYEDYMNGVQKILERLSIDNLKINPRKCEWAVEEKDCLAIL